MDIKGSKKIMSRIYVSFAASKGLLKKKEIIHFIEFLFSVRNHNNNRIVVRLICFMSFAIRDKLVPFINRLDETKPYDLRLKLMLLGSLGTKNIEAALPDLKRLANHRYISIRMMVYSALNSIPLQEQPNLMSLYKELLAKESNKNGIKKLTKIMDNIQRNVAGRVYNPDVHRDTRGII